MTTMPILVATGSPTPVSSLGGGSGTVTGTSSATVSKGMGATYTGAAKRNGGGRVGLLLVGGVLVGGLL